MVATRRGVRVCSPSKTNADESVGVQATPSTGRRTRRGAVAAAPAGSSVEETRDGPQESAGDSPPCSLNRRRRCTRSSRLHSPQQPSTPTGSVHEADVSDVESDCSALSDCIKRTSRKQQPPSLPRDASQEGEEATSEAESSSAPLSEKAHTRRSTRVRKTLERPPTMSQSDAGEQEGSSQKVTRSTRRTTPAKTRIDCIELSDAESWVSSASEVPASASSTSTANRATRLARRAALGQPIALQLETASEGSQSPAPGGGRRRGTRATTAAPEAGSEQLSCDSEGMESGPGTPPAPRRSARSATRGRSPGGLATDTDSDTPGVTRSNMRSTRNAGRLSVVLEKVPGLFKDPEVSPLVPTEVSEAEPARDDSLLEHTIVEETDCTAIEDETIHLDEKEDNNDDDGGGVEVDEGATNADLEPSESTDVMTSVGCQGGTEVSMAADDVMAVEVEEKEEATGAPQPSDAPEAEESTGENEEIKSLGGACEVTADDQQAEQSQDRRCGDDDVADDEPAPVQVEEPETMLLPPMHTEAPVVMEMDMDAGTETDKDAVLQEGGGSEEVVMLEAEQAQATPSQVSPSQEPKVQVEPVSEPTATTTTQRSVVVQQNKGTISLLDSSSEEEEEEDENECVVLQEEEREVDDNVECVIPGSSKLPGGMASHGMFMIDTRPGEQEDEQYIKDGLEGAGQEELDDEVDFLDEDGTDDDDEDTQMLLHSRNPKLKEMSSRIDPGLRVKELGGLYISFDGSSKSMTKLKEQKIQDELMKDSVIGPEFEKQSAAPAYSEAKRGLKLKRKELKAKTTGDGWYNMKAPELTPEVKADLKVLKMRGSLDPKRFYKKSDRAGLPKYFQVGTVMDSAVDFYHSRVPKKDRKRTMVEELVADADFRRQNKKKYQEIMTERAAHASGHHKKKGFHHKKSVA